jgi:alanyl-tRNA synthetase
MRSPRRGQHADATDYRDVADEMGSSVDFTGYNEVVTEGSVRGLITDDGQVEEVSEGESFELILDRTPFYAEGGGQLADHGVIELANGARIEVTDVQFTHPPV